MKYNLQTGHNKILELIASNNYKKAEKICVTLLKKHKKNEELWLLLINILLKANNHSKVARIKSKICTIFLNSHNIHNTLAISFRQSGQLNMAIDEYQIIISSKACNIEHYINLASLFFHLRKYNAVISSLEEARKRFTSSAELHLMLGAAHHALQNLDSALINYTTAFDLNKDNKDAITGMANIHFLRRDYKKAINILKPVIDSDPPVSAIILYCQICTENKNYKLAQQLIKETLGKINTSPSQNSMLYFISGKIYDALGKYDSAFIDYKLGNDLINPGFNYIDSLEYFTSIKKIFTSEFIKNTKIESVSDRLIFIVGMPRSGTSLIEQILSSHPDIYGAGELNKLNDLVNQKNQKNSMTFPDTVIHLSNNDLKTMVDHYLKYTLEINANKKYITDKMPDNFQYLGLINILFPQAKVIHCRRNAFDTCISCYFQQFSGDYSYSYDMKNLGTYYNLYNNLMDHWRSTLTIPMYEVDYESLTSAPEKTIRELLDFCNVSWNKSCLNFDKSKRAVTTASAHQINQPLYKKSVNRWKNYQSHIDDLINTIESSSDIPSKN